MTRHINTNVRTHRAQHWQPDLWGEAETHSTCQQEVKCLKDFTHQHMWAGADTHVRCHWAPKSRMCVFVEYIYFMLSLRPVYFLPYLVCLSNDRATSHKKKGNQSLLSRILWQLCAWLAYVLFFLTDIKRWSDPNRLWGCSQILSCPCSKKIPVWGKCKETDGAGL